MHDFIQEDGWFFTDYIEEIKKRGYTGKCYVPHDISVKSFESGRTRVQTLASAGLNPVPVPMHNVPDRINAAQLTIPRCRFNSLKCEHGLAGLREYCRDWDDRLKVFKDTPKHNWASHAADAFGYLAMGWKQVAKPEPKPEKPLFRPMTYDELDDDFTLTYEGNDGRADPTGHARRAARRVSPTIRADGQPLPARAAANRMALLAGGHDAELSCS